MVSTSFTLLAVAAVESFAIWTDPIGEGKRPDSLSEVPGAKRVVVLHATAATGGYNHNVRLVYDDAKGLFHAMWSNHRYGEDSPGQRVLHATSKDGLVWSDPGELMPAVVPEAPHGRTGLFSYGCEMFPWKGRFFAHVRVSSIVSWDSNDHSETSPVYTRTCRFPVYRAVGRVFREILPDGGYGELFSPDVGNFPSNVIPKIRSLLEVCPGFGNPRAPYNVSDAFGKDPENRRFCEPAVWQTKSGRFVSLLRDDTEGKFKWITVSDDGFSWTRPRVTDMPDAPSLSCAASLPDGRVVLAGNHCWSFRDGEGRIHTRDPLMISLSEDGVHFTRTWAVRRGCPDPHVPNVAFRGGGAAYPNVLVRDGFCYVIYSFGKEDIELVRIPLVSLR